MMAIGVANPRAQGQATMSTATALTSARGRAARHRSDPRDEGERAGGDTAGTNQAGDAIGKLLDGSSAALRLCDQANDLREQRLLADSFGAHQQGSAAVDAAADDARARKLLDGQRFAGDERLVHRAVAFKHQSVGGNLFAGTDAQSPSG